jgi:hypothetical protein
MGAVRAQCVCLLRASHASSYKIMGRIPTSEHLNSFWMTRRSIIFHHTFLQGNLSTRLKMVRISSNILNTSLTSLSRYIYVTLHFRFHSLRCYMFEYRPDLTSLSGPYTIQCRDTKLETRFSNCETRRLNIDNTKGHFWRSSWNASTSHIFPTDSPRFLLLLFSHLLRCSPSGSSPASFPEKSLKIFTFPIRTTYPVHPNLFNFTPLYLQICIYKSRNFSLGNNILQPHLFPLS